MSNMKDYAMWLDDKGIAVWDNTIGELIIPNGTNIHTPTLIDEYKDDAKWHRPAIQTDDDDFIIEDEDELIIDDGDLDDFNDCAWTPEHHWFHSDGGLTGDAYDFLATTDSQGDFI